MLKKNDGQIDVFNHMIFEKLIPKTHLLVKIDSVIDFSFIYEKIKDKYSDMGRASKDSVMMVKILLLEYLYRLSDVEVSDRINTDVAFRWFLGLGIDDTVPDDTTISYFRIKRLGEEDFDSFFYEIVKMCIEKDLVKSRRYIVDTTDVAANVNYPSEKKLIGNAFKKVIKEVEKFNENLANQHLELFEKEIHKEYENNETVSSNRHFEIAGKQLQQLYLKTDIELQTNNKYREAFGICYDIIDQYLNNKKDKIVSVVDPDACVAHKSVGNVKRAYKNHIIVDEDSEIILASAQTPFNTGDEKKLQELIEADKAYGTADNRAYLKDNEIISNIAFYKESSKEKNYYGLKDFNISEYLDTVTCPNGITTEEYVIHFNKTNKKKFKVFKFDRLECSKCPLKDKCLYKDKNGKLLHKGRRLEVPLRYDAVLSDMQRNATQKFEEAYNKRFKVERRFATMVRNHGLRRCRYLRLRGAKIHIVLANMACNIVRMVNLIYPPSIAVS